MFIHLFLYLFRIVPITGVSQLGWPTTSTTLYTHLHVSPHTHIDTHTVIHMNTLFSAAYHSQTISLSTAYGDLQVSYALIIFVVRTTLAYDKLMCSCFMSHTVAVQKR